MIRKCEGVEREWLATRYARPRFVSRSTRMAPRDVSLAQSRRDGNDSEAIRHGLKLLSQEDGISRTTLSFSRLERCFVFLFFFFSRLYEATRIEQCGDNYRG